jgi:hypothetical protein
VKDGVNEGVIVAVGVTEGVRVTDGVIDAVTVIVGVGVIDTEGVNVGVIEIDGETVGVGDGLGVSGLIFAPDAISVMLNSKIWFSLPKPSATTICSLSVPHALLLIKCILLNA